MRPVDQTRFGKPEGNCYAACLASILERPLEEFDHRPETWDPPDSWTESWHAFMATKGYALVEIQVAGQSVVLVPRSLYYIASGPSARGDFEHAVVHRNGKLAHDPHPSREGIAKVTWFVFVVPLQQAVAA